jgi:hypothetical protein
MAVIFQQHHHRKSTKAGKHFWQAVLQTRAALVMKWDYLYVLQLRRPKQKGILNTREIN